ncbi:hypothetical protein [Nocardioides sp.]
MTAQDLMMFVIASAVIAIVPGPDIMYLGLPRSVVPRSPRGDGS